VVVVVVVPPAVAADLPCSFGDVVAGAVVVFPCAVDVVVLVGPLLADVFTGAVPPWLPCPAGLVTFGFGPPLPWAAAPPAKATTKATEHAREREMRMSTLLGSDLEFPTSWPGNSRSDPDGKFEI
jgi:hypothetical protein